MNNQTEVREQWVTLWRAKAISILSLLAVSAALVGVKVAPKEVKPYIVATGLLTAIVGRIAGQTAEDKAYIVQDIKDISDQSRANRYYQLLNPKTVSALSSAPVDLSAFDWEQFRTNRTKYPHIALLGKTGGGKSTLAENLCGLFGGLTIAVAPHFKSGDYASADLIIGKGRYYGETALPYDAEPVKGKSQDIEPELPFADIINGKVKPRVTQFVRSLLNEMNRRYQLVDPDTGLPSPDGVYVYDYEGSREVNIILDEFNAYSKLQGVDVCLKMLIREARKVGIRLVLLLQGAEVKALGIAGEGSLRESLTFVRVMNFALAHARKVRNAQKDESMKFYWAEVVRHMESEERPVMVEDDYAIMPGIGEYIDTKLTEGGLEDEGFATIELADMPANQSAKAFDTPANFQNSVVVNNTPFGSTTFDERYNSRKALFLTAKHCVELGMKRSKVIKEVWGYKSERYTLGCQLWRDLIKDFGELEPNNQPDETDN